MNAKSFRWMTISSALFLMGCGPDMTQNSQSVGDLSASPVNYQTPAQAHQVQTKIITQYVPVPVPGQLMPVPNTNPQTSNAPVFYTQEQAVAYANKNAIVVPNSNSFFNAITTYDYMPGALYTIYTAPMRITDIALSPGEKIISDAAGDTLRWQVSQTYSGEGEGVVQHILVKPDLPNLENTMIINTNQRVYHLILKSTSNDTYMVAVNWRYSGSLLEPGSLNSSSALESSSSSTASSGESLDLAHLDFDYEFGMVQGDKPSWYPVRVFNDGRQTFIQFPQDFSTSQTPVLYVADNNGVYGTMVNWRLKGSYMIVDAIIHRARLQTGIEKTGQTIVQIQHT